MQDASSPKVLRVQPRAIPVKPAGVYRGRTVSRCFPFLQLAVLLVVDRLGPICAYRIYRVLRDFGLEVNESAVYTITQRLRAKGLLEPLEAVIAPGRRVKRYRLTPDGVREIERLLGEYEKLVAVVESLRAAGREA